MTKPFHVVLYGHEKCCLCHEAAAMLSTLHHEYSFEVEKIDVLADEKYAILRCQIPVVTIDGSNRVALRITTARLRRAFERASQHRDLKDNFS